MAIDIDNYESLVVYAIEQTLPNQCSSTGCFVNVQLREYFLKWYSVLVFKMSSIYFFIHTAISCP